MTLRGRLTAAFLAMVLGPVLLGAFFVGATMTAVGHQRSQERLDLAANAARVTVGRLCAQLHAVAGAIAVLGDTPHRAGAAGQLVAQGLATAVLGTDAAGASTFVTAGAPLRPWTRCAAGEPAEAGGPAVAGEPVPTGPADGGGPVPGGPAEGGGPVAGGGPIVTLAVRVELRDSAGTPAGAISAAQRLDHDFVTRLAAATGTAVTLLAGDNDGDGSSGGDSDGGGDTDIDGGPDGGGADGDRGGRADEVVHSTEPAQTRNAVLAAARTKADAGTTQSAAGRYLRRVGPRAGQPLSLVLSVPRDPPQTLYAVLLGAVALAGLLAVAAAWRLARSTTRPLAELAHAADQVADGNFAARVPVRSRDEVGWLASTFNRMTRELECYVDALATSRDQLRRHLAALGDTLSGTHDLQRILRVVLQNARAATGARGGVLLLLDPATGELVGQCAEGLGMEASAGPLRVPLGAGPLGRVAVTGEPSRGQLEATGPDLAGMLDFGGERRCGTYLAVPFASARGGGSTGASGGTGGTGGQRPGGSEASSPGTLGVLALFDRLGGDEFDDADLVTLRTFAAHAAVAVENVRVHEEAQRLSLTDPLTGLWNYRYLKESIRREVERANRFGRMLSVLALDLDRFKEVNDTHGHAAGDAVLVEFARRIRGVVREVDLVFRQGGEEFVVLLPETDASGAATVADRLGAAVRATPVPVPGSGSGVAVRVTVSIGIAVYPDHGATGAEVLDTADDALYAAKAAGRDTYRVAAARVRPVLDELPVPAGAVTPTDGLPWAGYRPAAGNGGASSGPHPPRPAHGR